MRQGIRDFLLVISVLVGGLATSLTSVAADDQQPAPTTTTTAEPLEAAQPEKTGDAADSKAEDAAEPAAGIDADPASDSEPAVPSGQDASGAGGGTDHSDDETHGANDVEAAHDTGDHADEHHDPYDLGHQNATDMIADPSQLRSDLTIWTLVVFLCLLAILFKFAWGPIMAGLERRETSIAAAIDDAEQAAAKGAEQLKLYEAKLAAAADETREILAQARKDAEATGERIVAEAQAAAARERDKAVADISAAKNSALQEITERSVDLAVSMAGRMIQRQLTPDDRAGLIREALEQLPNQN